MFKKYPQKDISTKQTAIILLNIKKLDNYSVIPILKKKQKFREKGCDFGDFV